MIPQLEIGQATEGPLKGTEIYLDLASERYRSGGFRAYIAGASGSGKTNLMAVLIEGVYDLGQPFLVIDPHGEYRSLTELAGVYTIGRQAGDIPLDIASWGWIETALRLIGKNAGVVVDLGKMGDDDKRLAYTSLAGALIDHQERNPQAMFLFVEEAHLFAPQKRQMDGPALLVTVKLAREGRKWGINTAWSSQRPRDLEADMAAQCNVHFCGRVEMALDFYAFADYLVQPAAARNGQKKARAVELVDMMELETGEFYVKAGRLVKVKINKRRTAHMGHTPEIRYRQRQLFDLDEVISEIGANDETQSG